MFYLAVVSVVWAFSFGLTKVNLQGVDPFFIAAVRLLLALLVFLPFLRLRLLREWRLSVPLFFIGAVQYGLMYSALFSSYRLLDAHDVVLFTCFTPLYVTLLDDVETRRFHPAFFAAALAAAAGVALAGFHGDAAGARPHLAGFAVMQLSNLCFAWGQVRYRNLMARRGGGIRDRELFAVLYLGGFLAASIPAAAVAAGQGGSLWTAACALTAAQAWTILYLGVLASGVCFFLWNVGARRTNTGTLAVFNNLKIPLGTACALLLFGEKEAGVWRLVAGMALILASLALNEWHVRVRNRSGAAV